MGTLCTSPSVDDSATAMGDDSVNITGSNLSGSIVWGPEKISARESVESLRRLVARGLQKQPHRIRLVKDSEVLQGESTLASRGLKGEVQLQVLTQDFTEKIKEMQASMGVKIMPGLSDAEVGKAEAKFGFTFPPELREFLQVGLPTGEGWHNWRKLIEDEVIVGSTGDTVSEQKRWNATPEEEGGVPEATWEFVKSRDMEDVRKQASLHALVPIRHHRMMPSIPHELGLPVLSMHQCSDLALV